jgi:tellurite resistance protein TerC
VKLLSQSTTNDRFVDLAVPAWAWVSLAGLILLLLAIDLIRHRDDHEPTPKEAVFESLAWVTCGVTFGAVVLWTFGSAAFGEYLSGYLIEKSLSVDNVFVWAMLFASMAIPLKYQHRVLFWGVFGALALRSIFIFAGTSLINRFWWILLVFGVFLVYTGAKIIRHRADEGQRGAGRGLGIVRRVVTISPDFDGHRFFTRVNGARAATPLLAALIVIEATDVIFAVDSVPAILAVSREPFLVLSSNASRSSAFGRCTSCWRMPRIDSTTCRTDWALCSSLLDRRWRSRTGFTSTPISHWQSS